MKPILPSRPNHSWLRRRLRDAMRGNLLLREARLCAVSHLVKWSGQLPAVLTCRGMNQLDLKNRNAVVTRGGSRLRFPPAPRPPPSPPPRGPLCPDPHELAPPAPPRGP